MLFYAEVIITAFVALVFFLFHYHQKRCCKKDPLFTNWPILGMIPPILSNLGQMHDHVTQVLKIHGGTGNFVGPWFTQMNYVVTCDPMNVHRIMSKNFVNYVKGPEFREIFEALGDGIFTVDSNTWKFHRSLLHSLLTTKSFKNFLGKTVQKKAVSCLIPLLDHAERQGIEVDLKDVFNRFNFDTTCSTILGSDPKSLAPDLPKVPCERAFSEVGESIFYRHTVPRSIWRLQRWLGIGAEKMMAEACKVFDQFLRENIASMKQELANKNEKNNTEEDCLLMALMREEDGKEQVDDKFLRDTAFNLFAAGRDTITSALTWFFWLVATHPSVEAKILEEIKEQKESYMNQVYLHGALCEALRLYPPIPLDRKLAIKHDVLPSGHEVSANSMILLSLYAMGRDEAMWGKDCLEFKPERWISERGHIIHVPSYKFFSFNAGPRTCLGKDLSFIQMKIMATSILWDYHVRVVEDYPISATFSIALRMKDGLKVQITKRG